MMDWRCEKSVILGYDEGFMAINALLAVFNCGN